jgi:hypothetical protein
VEAGGGVCETAASAHTPIGAGQGGSIAPVDIISFAA